MPDRTGHELADDLKNAASISRVIILTTFARPVSAPSSRSWRAGIPFQRPVSLRTRRRPCAASNPACAPSIPVLPPRHGGATKPSLRPRPPDTAPAKGAPLRKSPPIYISRKVLGATTLPKASPSLGQPTALMPPESPVNAAACSCSPFESIHLQNATHSRMAAIYSGRSQLTQNRLKRNRFESPSQNPSGAEGLLIRNALPLKRKTCPRRKNWISNRPKSYCRQKTKEGKEVLTTPDSLVPLVEEHLRPDFASALWQISVEISQS